jgi:hypothetical protein
MLLFTLALLAAIASGATTQCPSVSGAFADMHDGDAKNVSVSAGFVTISQDAPVAWDLTVPLNLSECSAVIDFSKSKKPAHPPVPLKATFRRTSVGTTLLEFTDPSSTIAPDKDFPLNLWTTAPDSPATPSQCAEFPSTVFNDMHDGDNKTVSLANGMLTLGQAGIWNLTTPINTSTCQATVDFSKTTKPAKPPVPLVVTVAMQAGFGGKGFVMTWRDPSSTISPSAAYPINMWLGAMM